MADSAPTLTPMLATPPTNVFATTNMLVCVLLLLLLCSEPLASCARVGPGGCGAAVPQARGTGTAIAAAQKGTWGNSGSWFGARERMALAKYYWVKVSLFAVCPPVL